MALVILFKFLYNKREVYNMNIIETELVFESKEKEILK